ncbi:MAG: Gfo/Idh/MocA family oxidoreductase [Kofleriaceae bacterium]
MISAAVVGMGVGEQHARAIQRSGVAKVALICDLDLEKARRLAGELGPDVAATDKFDHVVASSTEIMAIASYDDHHAQQVVDAFAAGKHVFCEKPLCRTREELATIERARRGHHLMCNLILRAAPLYRWLRDAIRAGELGDIYAFDGDYLYGRLHKITDGWRGDVENYSVIQGGGVHLIDLMMWLLDDKPARVSTVGNRIVTRESKFRYPDFVAATYEMPSGIIGRITANFGSVHKHQHVVRVFGSKATFIHDDMGARLYAQRDPGGPPQMIDHAPVAATKGDLIPDFLDAVIAKRDPAPAAHHEYAVITACMAADRALATAQPQTIEYV